MNFEIDIWKKIGCMKKMISMLTPPPRWRVPVILLLGIFAGLFFFAAYVANVPSYLSDNPATCMNCHVMGPQYATWFHSSHHLQATCNDCHVPNNNFFSHYYFKAKDGLRHASIFTLRAEPQVILIKKEGQHAVMSNCLRCHASLLKDSRLLAMGNTNLRQREQRQCWTCHRETPHGRVHSLSSNQYARVPILESPVPDWLKKMTE